MQSMSVAAAVAIGLISFIFSGKPWLFFVLSKEIYLLLHFDCIVFIFRFY